MTEVPEYDAKRFMGSVERAVIMDWVGRTRGLEVEEILSAWREPPRGQVFGYAGEAFHALGRFDGVSADMQRVWRFPEIMDEVRYARECVDMCAATTTTVYDLVRCLWNCEGGAYGCSCPTDAGDRITLPDFFDAHPYTQLCFFSQYSQWEWPSTCCCPPLLNAVEVCEPPSLKDQLARFKEMTVYYPSLGEDFGANQVLTPTLDTLLFTCAALDILRKNMDIALWAACLVQSWSPEMAGLDLARRLMSLATPDGNGKLPFTITFVDYSTDPKSPGATAWARESSIKADHRPGVYLPVSGIYLDSSGGTHTSLWANQILDWNKGGGAAFCVAIELAADILHELIHLSGDDYLGGVVPSWPDSSNVPGTRHEDNSEEAVVVPPCWDEARMVASVFMYGMSQRVTCLGKFRCCSRMGDPLLFAYSNFGSLSYAQLRGKCP